MPNEPSTPTVAEHAQVPPESDTAVASSYLPPAWIEKRMLGRSYSKLALLLLVVFGGALWGALAADGLLEAPAADADGKVVLTSESIYLLQVPFMIAYIAIAFQYLRRWLDLVVVSLRQVIPLDERAFIALVAEVDARNERTQRKFTTGYVVLSMLVLYGWDAQYPATSAFWLASMTFTSVIIGMLIAMVPLYARQLLNTLLPLAQGYNIFNPLPLHAIADFSLRVTLILVGAILFGELMVPVEEAMSVEHVAVNGVLVAFALALHLFTIYGAHELMVERKEEQLAIVSGKLKAAYERVQATLESGEEVSEELDYTVNSLSTLEQRVADCPEWPQNPEEVVKLLSTAALPVAMTLGKNVLEGAG